MMCLNICLYYQKGVPKVNLCATGKTKVQETFLTVKREAAESSDALYLKKELLKNIQDVLTMGSSKGIK